MKQRWSSTFINVVSTLIFGWKWTPSRRTFIDVVSTLAKQVKTTSIELPQFKVDEPTFFQCSNLVENESWPDVCLSTLFQRWQNHVETTLKELRRFNVDDLMLFQRWCLLENESSVNVCSSALVHRWENTDCCTDAH